MEEKMKTYLCEVETKDYGYGSRFKTIRVTAATQHEAFINARKCSGVEVVMEVIPDLSDEIAERVKSTPYITREQHEFIMNHYREGYNCDSDEWLTVCLEGNTFRYGRYKIDTNRMLRRGLTYAEFYSGGIFD